MRRSTPIALAALAAAAIGVTPAAAGAAPALNGEFDLSGQPGQMTEGPDGNVWVLLSSSSANNEIAKVAPDGTVTEYDSDKLAGAVDVVTGPDGNLWATKSQKVVKFSTADPTTATEYPENDLLSAQGITSADGNLWAVGGDKLVKIPPAAPNTSTSTTISGMAARGISRGSDGTLWIADFGGSRIVNVSPSNPSAQTFYATGGNPQQTEAGPNRQIAYSDPGTNPQHIGRIVPGGQAQKTPVPQSDPFGVAFGADGAYYVAQFAKGTVTRLTTTGQTSTITGIKGARYDVAGANHTVWVGEESADKIARISGVTADKTAPVLAKLGAKGRAGARPTVRFTLSEASTVQVRVDRKAAGKRRGSACVKPSAKLRRAKPCTRYVRAATLKATGVAGKDKLTLAKPLPAGSYRVTITAKDATGNAAKPRSVTLKIKAAK